MYSPEIERLEAEVMMVSKFGISELLRDLILFRFHVKFQGCMYPLFRSYMLQNSWKNPREIPVFYFKSMAVAGGLAWKFIANLEIPMKKGLSHGPRILKHRTN